MTQIIFLQAKQRRNPPAYTAKSMCYTLQNRAWITPQLTAENRVHKLSNSLQEEITGFESRQALVIFLFTTVPRPDLGPTQPPVQGVPGALSLGIKRRRRETENSPPSSADVKNAWSYISTPQYAFMARCSVKDAVTNLFYFTSTVQ
jgi:hypothetical protein